MSAKRGQMPEESARLVKIYKSHPEMRMSEVIEKYASDEYKAIIAQANDDDDA